MTDLSTYKEDYLFDTGSSGSMQSISKTLPQVIKHDSTIVIDGRPHFKASQKITCPRCNKQLAKGTTTIVFKHAPIQQQRQVCDAWVCGCGEAYVQGKVAKEAFRKAMAIAESTLDSIVTRSKKMLEVITRMKRAADSDASVLIYGESGTGKELVARTIHQLSRRHSAPFVVMNCAAMAESIADAKLFGIAKGGSQSAESNGIGGFQQADQGVLFLDEISELSPALQIRLLRALETGAVNPLGSDKSVEVDVRVIAATNRELEKDVADKGFRQDLFFRLNSTRIDVPPLRERVEDIQQLLTHFLDSFAAEIGQPVPKISDDALEALEHHSWPGNVRELRNVVYSVLSALEGDTIGLKDLPRFVVEMKGEEFGVKDNMELEELEKSVIRELLRRMKGDHTRAARSLGINRRALFKILKQYEIE